MHTFTDNDIDSATQRHLFRMNSKPWYALALKIPDVVKREKIKSGLDRIIGIRQTGTEEDIVYLVRQLSEEEVGKIRDYLESQRGIVSTKILKSKKYGHFVGNPKYWLRDYASLS